MKYQGTLLAWLLASAASAAGPPLPIAGRPYQPATIECVIAAAQAEEVPANVLLAIASVTGGRNGDTRSELAPPAFGAELQEVAARSGVDSAFVAAVIHAESAFNPAAVSNKGAQGLMQLMPATAARFGVDNPFHPAENMAGGTQYLAWLLRRYDGNTELASAAYNAGEGAVDRYAGVPPYAETRTFVERVSALQARYEPNLGHFALRPSLWAKNGPLARYPQISQEAATWDGCYNAALAAWLVRRALTQSRSDDYWGRVASYFTDDPALTATYRSKLIPFAVQWGDWLQHRYRQERAVSVSYQ